MNESNVIEQLPTLSKQFLAKKPFPVSDVFFNIDTSGTSSVDESIITNSFFTTTTFDERIFKFIDWFNANDNISVDKDSDLKEIFYTPDEQRTIVKMLMDLYTLVYAKLQDVPAYVDKKVDVNFAVKYDFGMGNCPLRCNYMPIAGGWNINVRTKPTSTPYMEDLDISLAIKEILLSRDLKNGLVLIVADHGVGKTTTATSLMVSRLRKFGGHCNAYEDPIEYVSQGFHGENGYCLQTAVEGEFAPYIKASMRKYPTTNDGLMYIGELRDSATTQLAIQASSQGCLVIATLHATSIIAAFKRLVNLISVDGNHELAADLLSSSFRFILDQRKTIKPKGSGWKKYHISGQVFYALNSQVQDIVNSTISKGSFEKLNNIIKTQNTICSKFAAGEVGADVLLRGTNVN